MKLIQDNTLPECLDGIARHRTNEAYAIAGQGLWLLKACRLHGSPADSRGQGLKSLTTVVIDSSTSSAGFLQWLQENVSGPECTPRISQGTCYNYMRAAAALGLTADSDEDDLLALRESNALGDRRISDLYKPALPENAERTTPSRAPALPEDWWGAFEEQLFTQFQPESAPVKALYLLPDTKLAELERQTENALHTIREVKAEKAAAAPKKPR
jgi:hypothetical protein